LKINPARSRAFWFLFLPLSLPLSLFYAILSGVGPELVRTLSQSYVGHKDKDFMLFFLLSFTICAIVSVMERIQISREELADAYETMTTREVVAHFGLSGAPILYRLLDKAGIPRKIETGERKAPKRFEIVD
jgi:hypothetical protein